MITKELITSFIEEKLTEDEVFLVEVKVTGANRIYVEIDAYEGVTINYCITINKLIDSQLDREVEDFELEVSSSSISAPFKVFKHYKKNLGKEVELFTKDNKKAIGILQEVNDDTFVMTYESMQKVEGKKKKELVTETISYTYDDVRSIKQIINFK